MRVAWVIPFLLCVSQLAAVEVDSITVEGSRVYSTQLRGKITQQGVVYLQGRRVGKFFGGAFRAVDGSVVATVTSDGVRIRGKKYLRHGSSIWLNGKQVHKVRGKAVGYELALAIILAGGHL